MRRAVCGVRRTRCGIEHSCPYPRRIVARRIPTHIGPGKPKTLGVRCDDSSRASPPARARASSGEWLMYEGACCASTEKEPGGHRKPPVVLQEVLEEREKEVISQ